MFLLYQTALSMDTMCPEFDNFELELQYDSLLADDALILFNVTVTEKVRMECNKSITILS